jgi:putative DNA primase/helicase
MSEMVSKLLLRMAELEPLSVRWAWDGFVPMGRLSMITGGPGVGKSLVALQIAAMMTRGATRLPRVADDGALDQGAQASDVDVRVPQNHSGRGIPAGICHGGSPRGVLVLSAGDDLQDTVLPRLIAAGADPSLVFCLRSGVHETSDESDPAAVLPPATGLDSKMRKRGNEPSTNEAGVRPFLLSRDVQKLSCCVTELSEQGIEVGLIVIDSIDRYVGANEKKSDRIEMVTQLADLASRSQAAVLVTANASMKSGSRGGTVVYQELFNVARSVLIVEEDIEATERRIVRSLKHNLTARPKTVSFVVEDGVVQWEGGNVRVSTADGVGTVREDGAGIDRANSKTVGLAESIEPLTFWLQSETATEGRMTRVSDSRKRDLKRRERKARRASQRRNRCRV